MVTLKRAFENPIILPSNTNQWERKAAFNGSTVMQDNLIHIVYRAQSETTYYQGHSLSLSTIGYSRSTDGLHFQNHRQLIIPDYVWELYGLEDPRITYFENNYYIFYTALSQFPFNADGIKVGLAKTNDFQRFEKHLITPFNAKAMALFPEKINGKI